LQRIERDRRGSIGTRNCRLAAIRSFFSFVADREPRPAKLCTEVLRVPFKRASKKAMCYLESAEVAAILSQPDQSTAGGQRDHTLLSLLYNTGARIQEALDLRPQDIHLKSPAHLRLMGKGQKERISPLCPETAEVVAALLRRSPRRAEEPVFEPEYHRSVATLVPRLWNKCSASSRKTYPERGGGRPPLTEKGVRASIFSRYRRSRLSLK